MKWWCDNDDGINVLIMIIEKMKWNDNDEY